MAQQLQQPPAQATNQQYSQIPSQQSQVGQQPQSQIGQQPQRQIGQQPQGQVARQQFGQQIGQQPGQRTQQATSPSLQQYEKTMPSEFRVALHDSNTLAEVAGWSKDQYLKTGGVQPNVTRSLEDLRDIAELNERFIAHDSPYGAHVSEAFLRVARQSLPELQQEQQDPVVKDTIPVVQRAIESTEKLLRSVGGQPSQQPSQLPQIGQQTPQFQQGSQLTPQFQQASQQTPQLQQKTRVGQQL